MSRKVVPVDRLLLSQYGFDRGSSRSETGAARIHVPGAGSGATHRDYPADALVVACTAAGSGSVDFSARFGHRVRRRIFLMNDTSTLLLGVLFGSVGLGFFIYGRKQQAIVPLAVGVALFVVPYVISNVYLLVLAGLLLVALPYFLRS
jgi:hypothetical protein